MNVILWVLQGLLAAAFLAHGLMYLFPPPAIAEQINAILPRPLSAFIGIAEVTAAVGLTLPGILRVKPWLVPLAALGLVPLMAGAVVLHASRGETSGVVTTSVLLVLAAGVAYWRGRVLPIAARRRA